MAKKIYDIKPPKVAHKVEEVVRGLGAKKKPRARAAAAAAAVVHAAPKPKKQAKKFPVSKLWIGGGAVLVLLGIFIAIKLPKAEVQVWPQLTELVLQEKVSANTLVTSVSLDKKIIPVVLVQEQKEASQEFPASGSASSDDKATGTIRVYNKFSPAAPLTLKAGTHFLSDSGKYFVSLDKIVIPAMKGKTAGSISVKVQAEEAGTQYNIGASKFSVPKLSGTNYYYAVWGESTADMTGGRTGTVKTVTTDDIENAGDTMAQKAYDDAVVSLRAKLSTEEILLDGAIAKTVTGSESNVKTGAVAEKFTQATKVSVSALVFKKADLEAFVKQRIEQELAAGDTYLEDKLSVEYAVDSVDMKAKTASVQVKISTKAYTNISTSALAGLAKGKDADQIKQEISSQFGSAVSKTEVEFWPFWVRKASKNESRTTVELRFE